MSAPAWDFVTVLENADETPKRATKVFSGDPYAEPRDYDDGFLWNSERFDVESFADLVAVLRREVLPHEYRHALLGSPKPGANDGPHVRRKKDKGDGLGAPYEAEAQHRYLIGDWDKCPEPLDANDIRGSVERARATLPEALRGAACAFFLSSNAHRKGTVRGKWIFPLDRPMSLAELKAHANAFGFDGSVCQSVQPIYFANPIFEGCADPLEGKREPIMFEGAEASLPAVAPKAARLSAGTGGDATLERARAVAERLPPSVEGQGGDQALMVCARELATVLDGDEAGILAVLAETFNPRCLPAWDDEKLEYEAARAAERRGKNAPVRQALARMAEKRDADAGDGASFVVASDDPLFVIHRGSVWIQENSGGYGRPVAARDLVPALRQKNLLEFFADEKGRVPPADKIYEKGGLVGDFEKDFRVPLTTVRDGENGRLVLVEGHPCRAIDARFDADVEAWLALLFGDGLDDAYTWIAACAQRYLDRPAACFIHLGPPDIGKSLIYSVLAYMWGSTAPVDLGSAITRFNGKITRCPIVLDDEARELAREKISTRDFRELVAAGVRDVELKMRECSQLLGCLRYAVTANGVHQLSFTDVDGADTLAALDTRIALHVTPGDAHDPAVAALARLRLDAAIDRADVPRIAAHFAWVQATVTPAARRFLGGRDGGPSAVLPGHARRFTEIYDKIGTLIAAGVAVDGAGPFVRARDGRLLVSTVKLSSAFPYDREALKHVQEALRPIRVERVKYSVSGKREETQAFWVLDEERLTNATESE